MFQEKCEKKSLIVAQNIFCCSDLAVCNQQVIGKIIIVAVYSLQVLVFTRFFTYTELFSYNIIAEDVNAAGLDLNACPNREVNKVYSVFRYSQLTVISGTRETYVVDLLAYF